MPDRPACAFISTLQSLIASNGGILGAERSALPHCQHLQYLDLGGETWIGGSSIADTWRMVRGSSIEVPAAMFSLTKLTTLQLHLHGGAAESTLDWIWQLTQLKELILHCPHKM